MIYILVIFIVFVGGGALIGKAIGNKLTDGYDDYTPRKEKESPMTVHNHITETHNHLHISKEDLKQLVDNKKSRNTTS